LTPMKRSVLLGLYLMVACSQSTSRSTEPKEVDQWPASFGFGRTADEATIRKLDIDVRPDGKGLPPGRGMAGLGKGVYITKCAACHGMGSEPDTVQLAGPLLVSNSAGKPRIKTIGNYWPYASTLFDYIRRAMPYNQPGSLTNEEVYNLTAYLLHLNKIIDQNTVIDAKTLPAIKMPALERFVNDDRKGGNEVR
jgi:S-disulfanyl-L-cysteine oxidoreductase SoxD